MNKRTILEIDALLALPEDQRTVRALIEGDNMTFKEVAKMLDLTVDSVRVKYAKANHAIKVFIENKLNLLQ